MFVAEVFQYGQGYQGPGGITAFIQQYFFLLVLLLVIPLLIVTYRLLFPNLTAIRATHPLRPEAETQRAREAAQPQPRAGPLVDELDAARGIQSKELAAGSERQQISLRIACELCDALARQLPAFFAGLLPEGRRTFDSGADGRGDGASRPGPASGRGVI